MCAEEERKVEESRGVCREGKESRVEYCAEEERKVE